MVPPDTRPAARPAAATPEDPRSARVGTLSQSLQAKLDRPRDGGGSRLPAPTLWQALAIAAGAGALIGLLGTSAGPRAIYYCAILGAGALVALYAATRREPARFAFFALLAVLPLAEVPIPPARFGVRVFDAVMLALALALALRRLTARAADAPVLLPSASLAGAWLLFVVSAACSLYPPDSAQAMLVAVGVYAFFLYALRELERPGGFDRLIALWAVALIVTSFGLLAEHWLSIDLSLRGSNLNELSIAQGREIRRTGGFFQDPQKAGAFVASLTAFLAVLAVRRRFAARGMRLLLWFAVALGAVSLLATIARAAIVACYAALILALLLANR